MLGSLFGNLIGRPVVEACAWLYGKLRELAYADVEGRHYQFRGNPIDTIEGAGSERWLLLSDVRRTVADLPSFASLRHMYPQGLRVEGASPKEQQQRIEAKTLIAVLAKGQDLRTRRFIVWLRQDVVFPAERKAELRRTR
ncbi:hypothetical protein [Roseateles violae]|uniref:Bro-N domain-containing protein n=1 Tax=Roseateles violae TaxID=3058042 RepID=A0ABT8DUL0_9BURK|nr:hypothetical protein [Pelomonas sp. PFR6]MDN3920599.1 hypothetical protein [Pelomonas sp. PFR6]